MMIRVMRRGASNKKPRATKVSEAKLDTLIEEATVDAYDESEQMMGFHTMLDEHLDMPFKTEVLGVEVTVEKIDLIDDDQIVVVCTRGKSRQTVLDLPLPSPPPKGAEWIGAFRRWARGRWRWPDRSTETSSGSAFGVWTKRGRWWSPRPTC
jgi:hypothetical protein